MNKDLLEKCGLAKWHSAGYAGKGIRVAVFDERPFITDDMKSYASVPQAAHLATKESHSTHVAKCLHEAAPEAEIFCLSRTTIDFEKNADWIIDNDIDIISSSISNQSRTLDYPLYKKLEESGIIICLPSGNDGSDSIDPLGRAEWTMTVGAAEVNGRYKTSYSNTGKDLDCLAYIPKITTEYYPQGTRLSGTSLAQPFAAGMIACYMQYAKENGLPYDRQAIKQFIAENCKDIYTEGKDEQSGYGVLHMPDVPSKVPQVQSEPIPKEGDEVLTTTKILLNGKEKQVKTIQHEGHNYIKLRDLVDELISVDYSAEKRMPILEVKEK